MTTATTNHDDRKIENVFVPAIGKYISVRTRTAKSNTTSPIIEKWYANRKKR
jgi:hypothetical protein